MIQSVTRRAFAKINLTLHVTGQRPDGYHLLDSLVVFAERAFDVVTVSRADAMSLIVTGPRAAGVPDDARNLCWRAAEAFGEPVAIHLEKWLPHPAGIGGGSSDAAAVLRAMSELFDRPFGGDLAALGADVPVCSFSRSVRMSGIGEVLAPCEVPSLFAVLLNPGVDVPTPNVFKALVNRRNPAMSEPSGDWINWLAVQRNDLEAPARGIAPLIGDALAALYDARLARMSGSGATVFGLYDSMDAAEVAADRIAGTHRDWWATATELS